MTSRYIWRFGAVKSEYYRCGGRARAPGVWVRIRFTDGWICRITIPQKFSDVASDEYFLLEILARISSHQENQSIDMIHLLTHTILALMWSTMPKVNLMPSVVLLVRTVSSTPCEDVPCVRGTRVLADVNSGTRPLIYTASHSNPIASYQFSRTQQKISMDFRLWAGLGWGVFFFRF